MKHTLILLLSSVIFFSCGQFYQVCELSSDSCVLKDDECVYENNDCRISYNFWKEDGIMRFVFSNLTDRDIHIYLPNSFLIQNGSASDYYSDYTHGNISVVAAKKESAVSSSVAGLLRSNTNIHEYYPVAFTVRKSAQVAIGSAQFESYKSMEYICVPSHASKILYGPGIYDIFYLECDNNRQNYPKSKSSTICYTKDNTSLSLRNRIAYTFDKQSTDYKYIDNDFYVSTLTNYRSVAAMTKEKVKYCNSIIKKGYDWYFIVDAPNRFYYKYRR